MNKLEFVMVISASAERKRTLPPGGVNLADPNVEHSALRADGREFIRFILFYSFAKAHLGCGDGNRHCVSDRDDL